MLILYLCHRNKSVEFYMSALWFLFWVHPQWAWQKLSCDKVPVQNKKVSQGYFCCCCDSRLPLWCILQTTGRKRLAKTFSSLKIITLCKWGSYNNVSFDVLNNPLNERQWKNKCCSEAQLWTTLDMESIKRAGHTWSDWFIRVLFVESCL